MESADASSDQEPAPTAALAAWIAQDQTRRLTSRTTTWAKHALLDWFGVALGGSGDPLVQILVDDATEAGETGKSRLVGKVERVTSANAALINGAASHALDFDDVNQRMSGHPSVAVVPAVLALAEHRHTCGRETIEALVIGYEVASHVGHMLGRSHDEKGWHATATIGTFGAAAAAAKLLGLDAEETGMALGIAATQAAGLQSMFGTMCKPLHAGRAAMNGLLAARWAARGFTSNPAALECHQGFAATQSTTFESKPLLGATDSFAIEANLFKYHAACFLTHASIDAANALRREHRFAPGDVRRIRARIPRIHLESCDIPDPRTAMQLKFSIRHLIAMAFAGLDTGDANVYTAATATRGDLVEIRNKVQLEPVEVDAGYVTELTVELDNGQTLSKYVDVGLPAENVDRHYYLSDTGPTERSRQGPPASRWRRRARTTCCRSRAGCDMDFQCSDQRKGK